MFDSVGNTPDPERARRSVAASGGVVALCVGVAGLALLTAREVVPSPPPPLDDMVLLFDVPNEPDAEWELPPPPEPAPPERDGPPDTGRMDTAIPGMDPDEQERDTGEQGVDTGEIPGENEGTGSGDAGTDAPVAQTRPQPGPVPAPVGPRTETPPDERIYDIPVRNRLRGRYPPAARRRNLGDVVCRMHAWVDKDGEARKVVPVSCPPLFRTYARVTLMEARWEAFDAPDVSMAHWRKVEIDVPFSQ